MSWETKLDASKKTRSIGKFIFKYLVNTRPTSSFYVSATHQDYQTIHSILVIPFDQQTGKYLAIPKDTLQKSKMDVQRYLKSSSLQPTIINILQTFRTKNNLYYVYSASPGQSLLSMMKTGPVSEETIMEVLTALTRAFVEGLETHKDFEHGNIRLDNIFIEKDNVYLSEFGMAKLAGDCESIKDDLMIYSSCDVHNKAENAGSDLWALGMVCYLALFCKDPIGKYQYDEYNNIIELNKSSTTDQYSKKNTGDKLKFPEEPKITEYLKDILKQMLIVDHSERLSWKSLQKKLEFIAELKSFQVKTKQDDEILGGKRVNSQMEVYSPVIQPGLHSVPMDFESKKVESVVIDHENQEVMSFDSIITSSDEQEMHAPIILSHVRVCKNTMNVINRLILIRSDERLKAVHEVIYLAIGYLAIKLQTMANLILTRKLDTPSYCEILQQQALAFLSTARASMDQSKLHPLFLVDRFGATKEGAIKTFKENLYTSETDLYLHHCIAYLFNDADANIFTSSSSILLSSSLQRSQIAIKQTLIDLFAEVADADSIVAKEINSQQDAITFRSLCEKEPMKLTRTLFESSMITEVQYAYDRRIVNEWEIGQTNRKK